VAALVIIGLRYYGGSLFGEFQNATEQVNSVGSNKPGMPLVVGTEESSVPGVGEQPKTSEKPAEEGEQSSSAAKQSSSKGDAKDLQSRLASLRPGVGEADDQIVSELSIDWKTIGTILGILVVIGVAIVFKEKRTLKAPQKKSKKKKKLFAKSEDGQVLVIGLIVCVGLFMASITVANVGMMVAEKIKLQDTVDAAAYSSAVAEARYMNLSAYLNRTMIANYDMMAFDTALWAVIDADDHGIALLTSFLYKIDAILIVIPFTTAFGEGLNEVIDIGLKEGAHHIFHLINNKFNGIFAQDDDSTDLNQYLEIYNTDILSMYEGLLYAAMQSSRYEIQREVAKKMDPEVVTTSVLGLGAEAVSFDDLAKAVDWVIKDTDARSSVFNLFNKSFNKMTSTPANDDDNPLLLAATTEASLNRFSAGRTRDGDSDLLRSFNFGHILPTGFFETALSIECEIEDTANIFSDYDCDSKIDFTLGAAMRDGYEDKADQTHVPFIARRRMREVNFFGVALKVSGIDGHGPLELAARGLAALVGERGHTSAESHADVGNVKNSTLSLGQLIPSGRALETIKLFGPCAIGFGVPPTCGLNSGNMAEAQEMPIPTFLGVDDHWDGTFEDIEPVYTEDILPPTLGEPDNAQYVIKVISDGLEQGVPKYDWQTDLDNVGFANYIYPTTGAEQRPTGTKGGDNNNFLSGPSIAVVGIKPQQKINSLQGLGIGNPYSMSALARAQVYYVRNPKRPDEVPSLFNPHWVARLAPIDSDDTPVLLKDGLPFISSLGLTVAPTH